MNEFLLIFFVVIGSVGVTLVFVGAILSAITALGNKQYFYGICILLFIPVSLLYCARNWKIASYPGKMVYTGTLLLLPGIIYLYIFIELYSVR